MSDSLGTVTFFPAFTAAITCPDIPDPLNGRIDFFIDDLCPFDYGTVATYSCDVGFGLEGAAVRVCEGDGSSPNGAWSGSAPSCSGKLYVHIDFNVHFVLRKCLHCTILIDSSHNIIIDFCMTVCKIMSTVEAIGSWNYLV